VVYLDPETLLPIDFETHYLNLDYANKYDDPKWELLYNYRDVFSLSDLSPDNFMNYATRLLLEEEEAKEYLKRRTLGGPGIKLTEQMD
jgi:hypothetical protein